MTNASAGYAYVNSVLWDYDVLLDPNKDFARAMQVVNVPHTFLVNGKGKSSGNTTITRTVTKKRCTRNC